MERLRQTANVRFKLRISQNRKLNKEIKKAQNNSNVYKWRETTNFCVKVMNSKQQVKTKVSLVRVQIAVNFILNLSITQPRTHV